MKELIRFQKDRGLDKKPFELLNETASIFEELLEAAGLDVPKENRPALKEKINEFVTKLINEKTAVKCSEGVTNHGQVDAFSDIITFATGAILKLGHDPVIAIEECGKEVNSRVGSMVDGKFEKDLSDEAKSGWYEADYRRSFIIKP